MLIKRIAGSILFALCCPITVSAAEDFVVIAARISPTMQRRVPNTADEFFRECEKDAECQTLAARMAQYLKAEPERLSAAIATIPRAQTTGEDGLYSVWLPVGYQYCRSIISTVGVIPVTGDWAASMMAESESRGVEFRTWAPMYRSDAQSRIEADVTIFGVRDGIADAQRASGKCKRYDVILMACRGMVEMNRGQPPCGIAAD